MMERFWWSHKENDKNIQWRSWTKIGESKKRGGLGFRDLESFNKAMLAKQIQRMHNNSDSVVAKIRREKYFKNGNLLEAKLGSSPTLIWRSI